MTRRSLSKELAVLKEKLRRMKQYERKRREIIRFFENLAAPERVEPASEYRGGQ